MHGPERRAGDAPVEPELHQLPVLAPHLRVRMSVRAHERGCACTRVRMRAQASARAHVCTGTRGRERARQGTHDRRNRVAVWRYDGAERIVEWHLPELRQDDGVNLRLR